MELMEHLFYVTHQSSVVLPETNENTCQTVDHVWAWKKVFIEAASLVLCRAVENYSQLFRLFGVINTMVRNEPFFSKGALSTYLLCVTPFNDVLHVVNVVFLVTLICNELPFQVTEPHSSKLLVIR